MKIGTESLGMLHTELPHLRDERVFHGSSPRKASGDTISGHSYPAFSTVCRIIILVKGLLMWEEFPIFDGLALAVSFFLNAASTA